MDQARKEAEKRENKHTRQAIGLPIIVIEYLFYWKLRIIIMIQDVLQ